jgi:hypothetical protein
MKRSIRDIPKKRGRPKTTGRGEGVLVRLHKHQIAAATLDPPPTRPEAMRRDVLESVCKLGGRGLFRGNQAASHPYRRRRECQADRRCSRAVRSRREYCIRKPRKPIDTVLLLRGLWPTRACRALTENSPKPRISTRSRRASASTI